jgi:hypothetical protein
MLIWRFSLVLSCPMKSASERGLRLLSRGASSSLGFPDTMRALVSPPQENTTGTQNIISHCFVVEFILSEAEGLLTMIILLLLIRKIGSLGP